MLFEQKSAIATHFDANVSKRTNRRNRPAYALRDPRTYRIVVRVGLYSVNFRIASDFIFVVDPSGQIDAIPELRFAGVAIVGFASRTAPRVHVAIFPPPHRLHSRLALPGGGVASRRYDSGGAILINTLLLRLQVASSRGRPPPLRLGPAACPLLRQAGLETRSATRLIVLFGVVFLRRHPNAKTTSQTTTTTDVLHEHRQQKDEEETRRGRRFQVAD